MDRGSAKLISEIKQAEKRKQITLVMLQLKI